MSCQFCMPPPTDFRGRPTFTALPPDKQPPSGTGFACAGCGALWVRRVAPGGHVAWEPMPAAARTAR